MIRYLQKISSNFSFEWNPQVKRLFSLLSPDIWTLSHHTPHRFLKLRKEAPDTSRRRFYEFMSDPEHVKLFKQVIDSYNDYMKPSHTIVKDKFPELEGRQVAYFSMEFGIDTLWTYSGGLGILSGDHIRGASDVGLNMVGVGLFYFHGYYKQYITTSGKMHARYRTAVPAGRPLRDYLPLAPVKRKDTRKNLVISIPIENRNVYAKVWRAKVGRAEILFLDTNTPENVLHDRNITYRLYQADPNHEMERKRRLEQEIILGVGGVKALKEAGYEPDCYHLNEGHVTFAAIEVIHQLMKNKNLGFNEAQKKAAKIIGFTTHTPVPEGNERFDEGLVRQYFGPYLNSFLNDDGREFVFNCARNRDNAFDMTKLALLLSGAFRNGVSKLHGEVCQTMWNYAWGIADDKSKTTPIGSITNSVHVPYWQSPEIEALANKACGADYIEHIPDKEVWEAHVARKEKLIAKIRERKLAQLFREEMPLEAAKRQTDSLLSKDYFLIGYARRLAGYKRANFILEDENLFFAFLEETYQKYKKPIAVIYAGKPHPSNKAGIDMIRTIYETAKRLEKRAHRKKFEARLIFVEGYNIELARRLVSGVDIWLNNPIRPLEASGTSGMKAAMNGVLNVSIPDGWCPEGIQSGKNGWLFGSGDADKGEEDRKALYDLLKNEILPAYFDRPKGLDYSPKWVGMMKAAIRDMTHIFNTDRMLIEYIEKMYLPAIKAAHPRSKAFKQKACAQA